MDLLQATNAVETMQLGGQDYPVRTLKLKEWAELQSYIARTYLSPLARAARSIQQRREHGEDVSIENEELILDHAHREELNWPPRVGSRDWWHAVDNADGGAAELVRVVLSKTVPGFDRLQAEAIVSRATSVELARFARFALYGERAEDAAKKGEPATPAD